MRSYRHVFAALLLAASLAGCAALLRGDARPSPEQIAERGLAALERGEYASGSSDLLWVVTYHPDRPVARYALLALAAAQLDPANPDRAAEGGSKRLVELRALPDNPAWIPPVAASLDRIHQESMEATDRAVRAERAAHAASERATRATAEVSEARSAESALRTRVTQLEGELDRSREELTRARAEVARMRRALGG